MPWFEVYVHLDPQMLDIIDRWGNVNRSPEPFIFGILDASDPSALQEYRKVNQAVKTIN